MVDGNVGLFSPHPELNPYYPDMIINLMNYLLKKNEGSEVMGLMDKNYDYKILKNDFKLMIDGVTNCDALAQEARQGLHVFAFEPVADALFPRRLEFERGRCAHVPSLAARN